MKYNAVNLIRMAAEEQRKQGDTGTAYALHELANNLRELLRGEATLENFLHCYTAGKSEHLDLDRHMPSPPKAP